MEKKLKKSEKPKLRKEDIGIPVNFVHVQHVGFGEKPNHTLTTSQSACSTPTFEKDSFFSPVHRRSDTSMNGQYHSTGKENRFSHSPLPPYSSMSNLSMMSNERDSYHEIEQMKLVGKKPTKPLFSGSLLNISFFPFSKSSGCGNEKSRSEQIKSKRLSLGIPNPASISFPFSQRPLTTSPPPTAPVQETNSRMVVRRRSSSFNNGDCNMYSQIFNQEFESNRASTNERNLSLNSNKKAKILRQSSLSSPPLSPSYAELPPPPDDMTFSTNPDPSELPASPTYHELPPPPSYNELPAPPSFSEVVRRKPTVQRSDMKLPPPPSPPVMIRRKLSTIPNSPSPQDTDYQIPPLQPMPVAHREKPEPPTRSSSKVANKLPQLKGKIIRVNAPTLPPLSVPLIRPKSGSPPTPLTWPLEPGTPEFAEESPVESPKNSEKYLEDSVPDSPESNAELKQQDLAQQCMQACSDPNNKCIDQGHVDPLSRLFQCRLTYKQWPTMMNILFSKFLEPTLDPKAHTNRLYGEVIKRTLELWLELEGGSASLDEVVSAFEQTQNELSQDATGINVTKL